MNIFDKMWKLANDLKDKVKDALPVSDTNCGYKRKVILEELNTVTNFINIYGGRTDELLDAITKIQDTVILNAGDEKTIKLEILKIARTAIIKYEKEVKW